MATSDAQRRASKKWQDANTDRLSVIAPRGAKAAIKAAAAAAGESVNAYIIRAVNARMASEGTPAPPSSAAPGGGTAAQKIPGVHRPVTRGSNGNPRSKASGQAPAGAAGAPGQSPPG